MTEEIIGITRSDLSVKEYRKSKEWKKKSLEIRQKVGNCQWPGCNENNIKKLQVHHYDWSDELNNFRSFYELMKEEGKELAKVKWLEQYMETENLIVLCKKHHFMYHKGLSPCPICGNIKKSWYKLCFACSAKQKEWPQCIECNRFVRPSIHEMLNGRCLACYDEMIDIEASKQ